MYLDYTCRLTFGAIPVESGAVGTREIVWDGTRRHAVLLVIGVAITLGAVGEIASLTLGGAPDWNAGITGVVAAMAAAGLVVSVRYNPLNDMVTRNRRAAEERTSRQIRRSFLDLLLLDLVLVVLAFPFGVVVAVRDDDPSGWFLSLLFGFLSAIALCLAWLVGALVVLPIVALVGALIGAKGSSRVAASGGAVFLSIVLFAVVTVLAVPSAEHGYVGRTGRVLTAVGVLLGLPLADAPSPALLWAARLALLVLVASMIWFAHEGRAAQRRSTPRRATPGSTPRRATPGPAARRRSGSSE
ncbi:hypothetical protein EDF64_10844 [Curtobacterium flaccumfaciens]|uniref:Uncharacterized protein n=1 Tax=Curtobacterium flaccumfaciens TaxID=2035 RepID=A0A4R6DGG9_9MICO|nr:hypothetical protein EDF64_10844 [Curtobacterium flaccumfaciens]